MQDLQDFPLQPFFVALAADRMPLSIRDYERIIVVLQSGGRWTLPRLRDSLLALLARDQEQQEIFLQANRSPVLERYQRGYQSVAVVQSITSSPPIVPSWRI